jgi:hypothetical protein
MLYIKASAKPGARPTSALGRWRGRKKSGDLKTDVDATRIKTRCSARDGASFKPPGGGIQFSLFALFDPPLARAKSTV